MQSIAFSGSGERLDYVTYASRANIWSLPIPTGPPVDTSAARVVTTENQTIESMSVSRDGQWLVYDSNLHLNADIFRMPIGGGPAEQLTIDPADDFCPEVSPDGTELAFHSWRSGSRDVFVKKLDGGATQQVTSTPGHESFPMWSPSGQALVFYDHVVEGGMPRGLFVVRRDRSGTWGKPVQIRAGAHLRGLWSQDERSIAYVRRGGAIESIDLESKEVRVVYVPSAA